MTTIKQLKKELGLTNKDLAQFFDVSLDSFQNTSAKKRYKTELKADINATKLSNEISEQVIKKFDEQIKKQ